MSSPSKDISLLLEKLGLSESEITLYLALHKYGALTAQEVGKLTHIKRPTVYYALRQLIDRGLAHKNGSVGIERFQSESADKIITLIDIRRRELDALEQEAKGLMKDFSQLQEATYSGLPAVSFYEGDEAVKQVVSETIYCRDRHIDSLAPSDNFFWQIGQQFSARYIADRVAHNITTRNLWEKPLEPEIMLRSYKGLSEVRILPTSMINKFKSTMFLYDDKVLYISSRESGYALLVKSKEHHNLIKSLYDTLWDISQKVESKI